MTVTLTGLASLYVSFQICYMSNTKPVLSNTTIVMGNMISLVV